MANGLMQMLKAFGIDIDPEEIKKQANDFKTIMQGIETALAQIKAQNDCIIAQLNYAANERANKSAAPNNENGESDGGRSNPADANKPDYERANDAGNNGFRSTGL
jgi:hypothetical protein